YGIYHPQEGTLNINGGTFNAYSAAVELRSGTLKITDGTFNITCSTYKCAPNGNGTTTEGAAIAIAQHNTNKAIVANITGGTFNIPANGTARKLSVANPQDNAFNNVTVTVLNTLFGESVTVPEGFMWVENGNNTCSLGHPAVMIGNAGYATLQAAINAATAGQTVTLQADIEATEQIEVGKKLTLDLNGKEIKYTGTETLTSGVIMVLRGADLTITDSSNPSTGIIESGSKAYAAVALTKAGETSTDIAKLTVNAGTLEGYYYAITGNGNRHGTEININGGTINGTCQNDNYGIYHPQEGTLNINGGTFNAYSAAVELRSGTLNISGGDFIATAGSFSGSANGSGTTTEGAALAISQHSTDKAINVNITGGTFSGLYAIYEKDFQNPAAGGPVSIAISGGTFNSTANENKVAVKIEDDDVIASITGGTFNSDVNDLVAEGKMAVQETENIYKVYGIETYTETDTTQEHKETVNVKDGNDNKQTITVSVKPTSEEAAAGDVSLNQVEMASVIDAVMENTVLGDEENVTVDVELQVNAEVKNSYTNGDTRTITFEVKPEAVVTINNQETAVELSNNNLAPNATFTFTLNITGLGLQEGELAKVVHKSSDPNYQDETFMATVWAKDNEQYVTITTTHFSEFEITNEAISANDDITLIDGTGDYNITSDVTVKSATYKRSFSEGKIGKYQSWFVPFDYTITAKDATKFNFFKINMIANSDTEGNAENVDDSKIWIHLKAMNVGETLYANKPYVIRPVEGEYTADEEYSFIGSTTLKAKDVGIVRQTATSVATYDFFGTYTNTESIKHHDFLYVSVNGQICWSIANWQYSVPPYRWIIRMTAKDGNYARTINFTENNSETTGISDVNSKSEEAAANYTISGQRVSTLKKGLYIVNGKKVIMK
ncbi:MAG: hypothetical protein J6T37_07185, partial [Bacteroidales bacterium]|nr:hypothetical protein [Bacteroidales bacterium]